MKDLKELKITIVRLKFTAPNASNPYIRFCESRDLFQLPMDVLIWNMASFFSSDGFP